MKCFHQRHPELLLSHEEQQLYQGNSIFGQKNLSLLQRNKPNILHSCIFRKINTQYLNRELPPHDKNPCEVSFLQHNEVIVLLRPQSIKTQQQFPHGEIAT